MRADLFKNAIEGDKFLRRDGEIVTFAHHSPSLNEDWVIDKNGKGYYVSRYGYYYVYAEKPCKFDVVKAMEEQAWIRKK